MRRWARRLALWLLMVLGSVVALVGLVLLLASTPMGGRLLRGQLLPLVNGAIPGRVGLDTITLNGSSVVLTDVSLHDPEENLVAKVARVEATIALLPLLQGEIDILRARVVDPEVVLDLDGRGLNLLRAVSKGESEPPGPKGESQLVVRVRELVLEDGVVDFDQTTIDPLARHHHVSDLHARGDLVLTNPGARIQSTLELKGRITQPTEGPLSLLAKLDTAASPAKGEVSLELAGLRIEATGNATDMDNGAATLRRLEIPHAAARAVLPAWPLIADLQGKAELSRRGGNARVAIDARAADGTVRVNGAVDLNRLRAEDLQVEADGLDFSKLVEKGPVSNLALRLKASGGGTSLQTLDGQVELTIPESTLDGQPLGPIALSGTAREGRFELARLDVKLPGASLTAKGNGTPERIRLSGELRAQNLARIGNTLGRIVRPGGIRVSGNGALSFVIEGPPQHPGVSVRGKFPALQYTDVSVRDLSLEGTLRDVRRPLDTDADLRAGLLQIGERKFARVRTALVTRGRDLTADVTSEGLTEIALHLEGTVDPDKRGFALADLQLRYPEATWSLERPTHVTFADGEVQVQELSLAATGQRLVLAGELRGAQVEAEARIEQLRLDRLPKAFIPESLGLAGVVDATVHARGTTQRPKVDAKLTLRGGAIETLSGLDLDLQAHYANDRAHGELSAHGLGTGVKGSFDAPISGLRKGTRELLALDLSVEPTQLATLFSELGVDPGVSGRATATLKVTGTAADPRVRLVVDGDGVKHKESPANKLQIVLESNPTGKLVARVDLESMGGQSHALLETPFTAAQFLTGPVNGRMFLETPARLEGSFIEFPVEALAAWGVLDTPLTGKASFTVDAKGAVLSPEGKVHLAVKGATTAGLEPMDLFGTLTASKERIEFTATGLRKQAQFIDLAARVDAPVHAFIDGNADLRSIAIRVDGDFGPIAVPELQALTGMTLAEEQKNRPNGLVRANLAVSGTLSDPKAALRLDGEQLGMGKLALGSVALEYGYEDAVSRAKLVLTSEKGGALQLDGSTRLDLSLEALRSGLAWRDAPVQAQLVSNGFDPSFLSSVTSFVRSIAGEVEADAKVSGTLGTPRLNGRLEWKQGRLALAGYGTYRDVHVRVRGTNDQILLEELTAKSGTGELKATARADRGGTQFTLTGGGELKAFPVIVDDQLTAVITGTFNFDGDAGPELVYIRNLALPEMHVELPDVRRQDLQGLGRPEDIVLVRKGRPVHRTREVPQAPAAPGATVPAQATDEDEAQDGVRYTIIVNAPKNLWVKGVKGTDVNAEIGLSEGFRIEVARRTMIFGEIRFLRGRVDVLGRRFDVLKDSQVRFAGPVKLPYINITAEHTNEREQVSVFTTVRGQGKEFTIKVNSQPALSESEIYTLLATGRRTLKRGSGSSMPGAEAATVATAYMASQLKRVIGSKIPLDVISFEAGANGFADASGEAGMYFTDDIYVGYQLRLGADSSRQENMHSVRLEYQFAPRWSLETEYGDARSGGADLIWSKDY